MMYFYSPIPMIGHNFLLTKYLLQKVKKRKNHFLWEAYSRRRIEIVRTGDVLSPRRQLHLWEAHRAEPATATIKNGSSHVNKNMLNRKIDVSEYFTYKKVLKI